MFRIYLSSRPFIRCLSVLFLFLIPFLTVLVSGCSKQGGRSLSRFEAWMKDNGKVKVLATTAIIDDIVGQVGGERVDHLSLICGEIDPHSYELVKGDDEKLSAAQIVFYNGLGLEHGASLRYQLEHHPKTVAVGQSVLERFPEQMIYDHGQMDPHIWMDIALWSAIIDPIVEALIDLDPQGRDLYEKNAEALRQTMLEEDARIRAQLQAVSSNKRYLVTSHDAFNYFTRSYLRSPDEIEQSQWEARFKAPEGLSPDGQLSAADIQAIIDHLAVYDIRVVFPESNVSRDSLRKIVHACRQKGFDVEICSDVLYGDAMGGEESQAETYLKMMRHNADLIVSYWKAQSKVSPSLESP